VNRSRRRNFLTLRKKKSEPLCRAVRSPPIKELKTHDRGVPTPEKSRPSDQKNLTRKNDDEDTNLRVREDAYEAEKGPKVFMKGT